MGPLVTPAMPVGQEAVDSMVNAFRQGQITSEDLVTRFGMQGRAQTQAGTSAAELAQQQAEAQKPLVEPTAQLQQAKIASDLAQTNWGQTSLKTAQETMGWFGDSMENYKLPNGQTDFQALAKVGAERVAQLGQVDKWASMLKPTSSRVVKLGDGSEVTQYLNALNQDVTPPSDGYDGSEQYWHYVTQLQAYMPKSHPLGGIYPMKYDPTLKPYEPTNSEASPAPHPTGISVPLVQGPPLAPGAAALGPYVTPSAKYGVKIPAAVSAESPQVQDMRAKLSTTMDPAQVAAMSTEEIIANSPVKDLVSAVAGSTPPAPAITPAKTAAAAALPVIEASRPRGAITKFPEQTVYTAEKIREGLMKESPYQSWQKTVPYAVTFETNANEVRNKTPQQQGASNMNMVDLGLAESLIKLYDPEGVIREFKWEKFETNQPRMELLKNAWDIAVHKRGSFTPETRAQLVKMGEEVIQGREQAAKPAIQKAFAQAATNPKLSPDTIFTSEDQRIMASKIAHGAASPKPGADTPPAPGWTRMNSPKYGQIWWDGKSNFIPVSK